MKNKYRRIGSRYQRALKNSTQTTQVGLEYRRKPHDITPRDTSASCMVGSFYLYLEDVFIVAILGFYIYVFTLAMLCYIYCIWICFNLN
jgi:hypothetical protein